MASHERPPRTGSVRGFFVFGLAGILFAAISGGMFYRFLAHRWWYASVVETTPSVSHLFDLFRWQGAPYMGSMPAVMQRIETDSHLQEPYQVELLRRYHQNAKSKDDVATIMYSLLFMNEKMDIHHQDLWDAVVEDSIHADVDQRWMAVTLMTQWPEYIFDQNISHEVWQAYQANRDIATRSLYTGGLFSGGVDASLARTVVRSVGVQIFDKLGETAGIGDQHASLLSELNSFLVNNPSKLPGEGLLAAMSQRSSSEWFDPLVEIVARDGRHVVPCLNLVERRPELAQKIWSGLQHADPALIREPLGARWDRLCDQAMTVEPDKLGCPVITTLKRTGDARFVPWLQQQIAISGGDRRRQGIEAVGILGRSDDAESLVPYLSIPETRFVAAWSIRHLDNGRIRKRVLDEMWTDPAPSERLEILHSICPEDPLDLILSDPRMAEMQRESPLYQALVRLGLTQDQGQHLDEAVQP